MKRGGPIRGRRPTPRRRTAPRWTADQWASANTVLLLRCGQRCEGCGADLNRTGVERAHRQRRVVGGDRLANLLMLCAGPTGCHAWSHAHPVEAQEFGWIVSAFSVDPADVPVTIRGRVCLLDDMGTATPV